MESHKTPHLVAMATMAVVVLVTVNFVTFTTGAKWDGFRASFKVNLLHPYAFHRLPRTVEDALADGYVQLDGCTTSVSARWRGNRYIKDADPAIMLLYDVNGYIAGLQTSVPKGLPNNYPERGQIPLFVEDTVGDRYVLTSYFIDPARVCTTGRTAAEFATEGTGRNLYIQNGSVPEDSLMIPRQEKDIQNTKWVQGKCFPTMGVHYWYDISRRMNCHDFYPVFVLYNKGELNSYGFVLWANLKSSRYDVQPLSFVFPFFFKRVPLCTYVSGRVTPLHVYLTDRVDQNLCDFGTTKAKTRNWRQIMSEFRTSGRLSSNGNYTNNAIH